MANGHGGYRKPTNPAPVSGPGALSRRTDGQPKMDLPNARYGEAKEFDEIQSGAQMAAAPRPQGGGGAPNIPLTPLGAPSARPDEPVTAGAALGPGPGVDALGLDFPSLQDQELERMRPLLPAMEVIANMPGSGPMFRAIVYNLKSRLRRQT